MLRCDVRSRNIHRNAFYKFRKNPIYIIPTISATKECMDIVQKEYGNSHHLSNKANAFRHVLWVVLIIQKCLKWKENEKKAKLWAKKFTNWHEDFSPNEALERTMDLHNNTMGLLFFEQLKDKNLTATVSFLKQKTSEAVKILNVEEVENIENKLIYID